MIVIKCDRCGADIDKSLDNTGRDIEKFRVRVIITLTGNPYVHICAKCRKELVIKALEEPVERTKDDNQQNVQV